MSMSRHIELKSLHWLCEHGCVASSVSFAPPPLPLHLSFTFTAFFFIYLVLCSWTLSYQTVMKSSESSHTESLTPPSYYKS